VTISPMLLSCLDLRQKLIVLLSTRYGVVLVRFSSS
jgi:hypothetical protein